MRLSEGNSSMGGNGGRHYACEDCAHNCQLMHEQKTDLSCFVSRFFKILVGGDWPKALLLPPSFESTVAEKVGQGIELENVRGQKWTVTLSSFGDRYAFQKGWGDFVLDNDLNGGDFLVFNYVKGHEGSNFVVHAFGRTGREKNCNGVLKRHRSQENASAELESRVRKSMDVTERSIQSPLEAPGLKSKPSAPGPTSKPCAPGQIFKPSAFRQNSKPSAPGPKSKPSSVPQSICKPTSGLRAQNHGGDDEMLDNLYSMSNHEVHKRQAYGNKKGIDRGIGTSNPDVRMTRKSHTAEAMKTKINDLITIKNMKSNIHTGVTGVSMAEKDHTSLRSLAESNKDFKSNNIANEAKVSMMAKDKPSVFRDDSTRLREKENSASLSDDGPFRNSFKEPGQKGNYQDSPGANNGAVFPESGEKFTGHLEKIVKKEQLDGSEPGHNDAKRKRDYESALNGGSDFKQVKTEPYDDSSAHQDIVTCLAEPHGQCLELPGKLPALKFMKRGSKAVYLLDQNRILWPALYEESSGWQVLLCHWDTFNLKNGIQNGDSYTFTVENASEFIYRIDVVHPV